MIYIFTEQRIINNTIQKCAVYLNPACITEIEGTKDPDGNPMYLAKTNNGDIYVISIEYWVRIAKNGFELARIREEAVA